MDMSEHMMRIVTLMVGTILSAVVIGVGAGIWNMSSKINNLDTDREVWQQRVTSQLEHINLRVNGAYTSTDAREDRIKTEQVLNEQQHMLRRLESRLERLQKQVDNGAGE